MIASGTSSFEFVTKTAGLLLVVTAVVLGLMIACPTNVQCFILYTLIGIGIALILAKSAEKTTAKFKIDNTAIALSGGVAIPFILFFTNPIQSFKADKCRVFSTGAVVVIHARQGNREVKLGQGVVVMDVIGKESKRSPVNDNGQAVFQNVGTGDSVKLSMDFSEPYEPVAPDSVYIIRANANIDLVVRLKGLNRVIGKVFNGDSPLAGVSVELEGRSTVLKTVTDTSGYFAFTVPLAQQQQKYLLNFSKTGFKPRNGEPALPQTEAYVKIVMDKL